MLVPIDRLGVLKNTENVIGKQHHSAEHVVRIRVFLVMLRAVSYLARTSVICHAEVSQGQRTHGSPS